jgi:glycosyltransferase involved in cell wall biosynthesis
VGNVRIAILGIKGLPSRFGADRVVEAMVEELSARHQITVYACAALIPRDPGFTHFRQIGIPSLTGKYLRMPSVLLVSALHALLRGRYDLVHVHNFEAGFIVPLLRLRFPVVTTSHGPAYLREKWGGPARLFMRFCDRLSVLGANATTAVSRTQAEEYRKRFHRPVEWIPNAVPPVLPCDCTAGEARLAAVGAPLSGFLLFVAGRILPSKGCHLLLEAVRELDPALAVVIVGDSSAMPQYEAELRALGRGRAFFVGFIEEPATLFGLAASARLFVFPSLVEAMAMTLLEIAALEIPAVVSDIPENRSVLDERHVRFFRSGDAADLARALRETLQDPDGTAERARTCGAFLRQTYRRSEVAARYERVYARAVHGNHSNTRTEEEASSGDSG